MILSPISLRQPLRDTTTSERTSLTILLRTWNKKKRNIFLVWSMESMEPTLSNTGAEPRPKLSMELRITLTAFCLLQLTQLLENLKRTQECLGSMKFKLDIEVEFYKANMPMKVLQLMQNKLKLNKMHKLSWMILKESQLKKPIHLKISIILIQSLINRLSNTEDSCYIWSVSCTPSWGFLWSLRTTSILPLIRSRKRESSSQTQWTLHCSLSLTQRLKVLLWSTVSFSVSQILESKLLCSKLPSHLWLSRVISTL